jgi:predicted RNA binding protein YcfA (HicA-like mRNA interferase family)
MVETNSKKIIKRLKKEGFELVNTVGSHQKFAKGNRRVTVPHPKKDIPIGTARQIARQAGWM